MILDGWGISKDPSVSAIDKAKTPYVDSLYSKYPSAELTTFGQSVGLPDGQMGNSEVGHMNLGAGRIVYQDLARINLDIEEKTFKNKVVLKKTLESVKKNNSKLHLIGLVSDGGVHSHISHLEEILSESKAMNLKNVFVHAFTDGRDVDPKSGLKLIGRLNKKISECGASLSSLIGRYYAMDRDKRWERTKKAYDLLVNGKGKISLNIIDSLKESYKKGVTDEFIEPIVLTNDDGQPKGLIKENDYIIFFNFRTDRGRQLTQVLTQENKEEYEMKKINLNFVTLTNYDESFSGIKNIYEKDNLVDTLGEILEKNKKKQIRIAETEKYPHVTFFFNGGREKPFKNETRILCPSPKVATYDLKPEMSANEITDSIIKEIDKESAEFICLNFANPDMVGHTGDINAAIKACETVDYCASKIIELALKKKYSTLVIADHGNCDVMINPDGSPNTAHTTNMVPIILVDNEIKKISDGVLGDIAPTILELMKIKKPNLMTCESLLK